MRIDSAGLHPNQRSSRRPADGSAVQETRPAGDRGDRVEVSSSARLLSLSRHELQNVPDVRQSVVDGARVRLSNGTAHHDGSTIARAMIDTITEETGGHTSASLDDPPGSESP